MQLIFKCWPCILQLYWIWLLILTGFYGIFRVSMFKIVSPLNTDNCTSFFPIWMTFISFTYLIALSSTSSTVLIKSGKSGHPCFVSDFRKVFSLSPMSIISTVGSSYMTIIILKQFPSITHLLSIFNHKKVLNFVKYFFSPSIEMII